jgi:hypothetical protein
MKLSSLPKSLSITLALFISASLHTFGEEPEVTPENPGISSPTEGDNLAMEGMRVEEGLGASRPTEEINEAQQSYINNKAQQDEEIKQEEADAEETEADAQEMEAFEEPFVAPEREVGGAGIIVE